MGLLLPCQTDCFLRSVDTIVTRCDPEPGNAARHLVILQSSPFYPEGGGQPNDTGTLRVSGSSDLVPVVDVKRQPDGSVAHYTCAPLPEGATVTAEIDWARRFDLMQQHTGQHLLSAVCDEVTGADTVSWELHAAAINGQDAGDDVAVDLAIPSVSPEQMQAIEARCNALIRAACAVRATVLDSEGSRGALANSPILRGALPPPDTLKGPTRVVEIAGVDINACGGTHLRSTAELQVIKLLGQERAKGMARLRFQAGGRVLATLGRMLTAEAGLNKALGCGPAGWQHAVARLQSERRELSKRCKALQEAAAAAAGAEDDADLGFLSMVAAAAAKAGAGGLLFLTGGLPLPKPRRSSSSSSKRRVKPGAEGCFVLAGPADAAQRLGPKVAEALGAGKGGGRPGLFQGKMPSMDGLDAAMALLGARGPQTAQERRRAKADLAFASEDDVARAQRVLLANAAEAERQLRQFKLGSAAPTTLRPSCDINHSQPQEGPPPQLWPAGSTGLLTPVCALQRPSFEDGGELQQLAGLRAVSLGTTGLVPVAGVMLRPSSDVGRAAEMPLWPAGATSAIPPLSASLLRASLDGLPNQDLPLLPAGASAVALTQPSFPAGH